MAARRPEGSSSGSGPASSTSRYTVHEVFFPAGRRQQSRDKKAAILAGGLLVFLLCLAVFCWPRPLQAAPANPLEKEYTRAKADFEKLRVDDAQGAYRANWEQNARRFRTIFLGSPKGSDISARALFMLGRVSYEMHTLFQLRTDLEEALEYFRDVTLIFPEHRLADDALYLRGYIHLIAKNDRMGAIPYFTQVVERYPKGDMAPAARKQLAEQGVVMVSGAAGVDRAPGLAQVEPLKYWSTSDYTRVVVQLSGPAKYGVQLLEGVGDMPPRLVVDFGGSVIPPESSRTIPIGDGLLKRVRAAQYSRDTVRVVLDIDNIVKYKIFSLQDPFRVVIDVKGLGSRPELAQQADQKESSPGQPPVLAPNGREKRRVTSGVPVPQAPGAAPSQPSPPVPNLGPPSLAQQLGLTVRRIVIDPGHGGKDPGAIAPNGLKEKDVVLAVAKIMAAKLRESLGAEVVLTRSEDVFLPLEERTAIANTRAGDLFISLHVNAAPSPDLLGVETYYLDLASDEAAMRLAALENATTTHKMSDMQAILADLLNNAKKDESAKLAQRVQLAMAGGLGLKNLGVKKAPFYVLIGAQMPAVLSEMTFLSNPGEAARLTDPRYLETLALQLATGVSGYVRQAEVAFLR